MSLVLLVILPAAVVAGYMFAVAKDQFSSTMGFAVRTEDVSVSSDIFGSLAGLSSIGATDTDILYESEIAGQNKLIDHGAILLSL